MGMAVLICRMEFIFSCTCLPVAPLHPLLTRIVGRAQHLSTVLRHCAHEDTVPMRALSLIYFKDQSVISTAYLAGLSPVISGMPIPAANAPRKNRARASEGMSWVH